MSDPRRDEIADGERWVEIGQVKGIFGVRGEMRVQPFTETPEGILGFERWWIGRDETQRREYALVGGRPHGKGVVATVTGITDPEQVRPLLGCSVWVPRALLPETSDEEFYWADLVGCRVVSDTGDDLGAVTALMATGANDVLVVRRGGEEILLPFTAEVVLEVDVNARRLVVHLLPGLLD